MFLNLVATLAMLSHPFVVSAIPALPLLQLPSQPSLSLNNSAQGLSATYNYQIPNTDLRLVLRPFPNRGHPSAIPTVLNAAKLNLEAQIALHGQAALEVSGEYNYNVTDGMLLRIHAQPQRAHLLNYGIVADIVRGVTEWEGARWSAYLEVIFSIWQGPVGALVPIGNGCLNGYCPF